MEAYLTELELRGAALAARVLDEVAITTPEDWRALDADDLSEAMEELKKAGVALGDRSKMKRAVIVTGAALGDEAVPLLAAMAAPTETPAAVEAHTEHGGASGIVAHGEASGAIHEKFATGISYAELGGGVAGLSGDTPCALLIHGFLDSWKSWSLIMPELAPSTRVIALTLRGWGDSDKTGEYGIDAYAADVLKLMDTLGVAKAVLCGHAMGSLVSTLFAARYPTRVEGLVLCSAVSKLDPAHVINPAGGKTLGGMGEDFCEWHRPHGREGEGRLHMMPAAAVEYLQTLQLADLKPFVDSGVVPSSFGAQVMAETLKANTRSCHETWADMMAEDHRAQLGDIRAPVLILWGDQDAMADGAEQGRLRLLLKHASSVVFETFAGAPHNLIWTHAKQCAAMLNGFMAAEWGKEQFTDALDSSLFSDDGVD